MRETTARLAAAAAGPPPATVRQRVLAEAARTRQLPPAKASPAIPRLGWPGVAAPGRTRAGWRIAVAARLRLVAGLAGVLLLAATAAGVGGVARLPSAGQPPPGSPIASVLTAPDAAIISAPVRTGGSATVVMSSRAHLLVFAAAGLRALPASECYELWLMGQGQDRMAGLLPMPRHGMTGPVLAAGGAPRGPAGPDRGTRWRGRSGRPRR